MYKVLTTGFWARQPEKVKRASFLASMKEVVKMCNQAPNADIFYFVNKSRGSKNDVITI